MKWLVFFPHHREEPIFSSNPPFSSKRRNRRRTFERNTLLQTEIDPDRQTERDVNDDDAPEGERSFGDRDDETKKTNKAAKTRRR